MSWKDDEDIKTGSKIETVKEENETKDNGFSSQEASDKFAEYVDERKVVDELDTIDKNNAYIINKKRTESYRVRLPWQTPRVSKEDIEIQEEGRHTNDLVDVEEEMFDEGSKND